MLKKKNDISAQNFDTLIGKNATFQGTFKSTGLLRIDGKFEGDIDVNGDIIIGQDGIIIGNAKAVNIEISGTVEGNVFCSERLKICSTGKLIGDIEVGSFVVEEKGLFDGKCKMKNEVLKLKTEDSKKIKAI
ncbi:protein CcmA, bactofilin family [Caminicella sporogenes DSM 14501]|uniref:Protein CcmA, bactofilin family n=1 Tax=Caminicella sporogenes DSM 14501 TaxID=1121266 RepID=A0A1M6MG78_9FIRM|nr:polymer-forming cytoskeletal protein [Caminicella sporogenes]RKD27563.1 hypothetical protein BET04_00390 [Caminicella sporogenes]WIF94853.1 polymer-forming cytoskeletal protein [Caminicella sporogenes]SHJ82438.1 protein CcmA, bactofilin family [Caminicella sporogenes DSM 14501]